MKVTEENGFGGILLVLSFQNRLREFGPKNLLTLNVMMGEIVPMLNSPKGLMSKKRESRLRFYGIPASWLPLISIRPVKTGVLEQ
jgi:hypothetical protein